MAVTATVQECCDAIHASLGQALVLAGALVQSQNAGADPQTGEGLTEGINDPNILQVYPEELAPVSVDSGTIKITLGKPGNKYKERVIFADYYCKQRANIGEDMALLVAGIDAIEENLDAQECPYFEEVKIKSFQYSWQRVVFSYGEPQLNYIGARFRITLRTF